MIEVKNLSKNFRVHIKEPGLKGSLKAVFRRKWQEKAALRNVSLSIKSGEIVGLVGANGAGKTTLVKILTGIIHPTSGEAEVLGYKPWERQNDFKKQIALLMGQKAQLWWDLPASDCFLLLQKIYQIPQKEFQDRLGFLTSTLGIENQLNIQVRRLSLGERMKMELIASLLHQPRVVFLDEPTIGLDLTAQKAVRKFLLEYRRVHQPAMILTSHYMEDIEQLCERIVIIREGEFIYDGPLKQIVQDHARHKVINIQLKDNVDAAKLQSLLQGSKILLSEGDHLRIATPREQTLLLASQLLTQLPIHDLTIENEEIGNIIESLMKVKKK